LGQAVVVEKTFVRAIRETDGRNEGGRPSKLQKLPQIGPAVLSGANTVQTRCLGQQHSVKSTAEVGGKNGTFV